MQVFFLAERKCMLRVNGMFLGLIDLFERSTELSAEDGIVCELIPLDGFLPVTFRFDEDFLLQPPPQIKLYYTKSAVAVYCCDFLRADQSLHLVRQEKIGNTQLTLTVQGTVQLYLQNDAAHLVDLPQTFESCTVRPFGENFLLETDAAFALVTPDGKIPVLSEGKVLSADGSLKAEVPFHDCLGHTAICEWTDGKLTDCSIRIMREPTNATVALALFESVLIGADASPFLTDELAQKAHDLREFTGAFVSVVLTDDLNTIGLVYPRKKGIFDVRYYQVELENGKVSNITPCD